MLPQKIFKHGHSEMLSYVISCGTFLEKIKTNVNDNPALVLIATGSNNSSKINKIIPHLISRLILIGRNGLMWTVLYNSNRAQQMN